MALIPADQNLFLIDLHYIAALDDIDSALDAHVEFLERHYASGQFIVSGPKVPRTGGVILATAPSRAFLEDLLEADPFKEKQLARYTISEFRPAMKAAELDT